MPSTVSSISAASVSSVVESESSADRISSPDSVSGAPSPRRSSTSCSVALLTSSAADWSPSCERFDVSENSRRDGLQLVGPGRDRAAEAARPGGRRILVARVAASTAGGDECERRDGGRERDPRPHRAGTYLLRAATSARTGTTAQDAASRTPRRGVTRSSVATTRSVAAEPEPGSAARTSAAARRACHRDVTSTTSSAAELRAPARRRSRYRGSCVRGDRRAARARASSTFAP